MSATASHERPAPAALSQAETVEEFARRNIPLFLGPDGQACLSLAAGPLPVKAVVCSIPKSGTYLFAELLKRLGLASIDVHLANWGFTDCRFATQEQARSQPQLLLRTLPSFRLLPLVRPGQFLVGHLPCSPQNASLLADFKILYTHRDLRTAMVSFMRYMAKNGLGAARVRPWARMPAGPDKLRAFLPEHGLDFVELVRPMLAWPSMPGVLSVSYEQIVGDFGQDVQRNTLDRIAAFLGAERPAADVLEQALATETITSSGRRSELGAYWCDEAEAFFQSHLGLQPEYAPAPLAAAGDRIFSPAREPAASVYSAEDVGALLEHARTSRQRGQIRVTEECLAQASEILDQLPTDRDRLLGELWVEQGCLACTAGRWPEAEPLLRSAAEKLADFDHAPVRARALYELGCGLRAAQSPAEAIGALEEAVALLGGCGAEHELALAAAAFELGCTLREAGKPADAIPQLVQAAELQSKFLGAEHGLVAMIAVEHGLALRALGQLEESAAMLAQAVAIEAAYYGPAHQVTLRTRTELAAIWLDMAQLARERNDLAAAGALAEQAIDAFQDLGAPGLLAGALFEAATVHKLLGHWAQAADRLEQAAVLNQQLYGPDDWRRLAMVLVEQALAYRELGRVAEARPLVERALAMQQDHFGGQDRVTKNARAILSQILVDLGGQARASGRLDDAQPLLREAIDWARQLSPEPVVLVSALDELAGTLRERGQPGEAESLLLEAIDIATRLGPDADGGRAAALASLAHTLRDLGRAAEAITKFEAAAALQSELLGTSHWMVATLLVEQAVTCRGVERWTEARALLERALDIQVAHFGRHDSVTHNARSLLGQVLSDQGKRAQAESRSDEAANLFRGAIDALRESAPGSAYLATAAYELARVLRPGDRWQEAETALAEALEIAVGPEMAVLRIGVLCELAASLRNRGRALEAVVRFAEAAEMQRVQLGPEHWQVGVLLIEQALVWEQAGELVTAIGLLDQALAIYSAHFGVDHQATTNVRDKRQNLAAKARRPRWLRRLAALRDR